MQKLDLLVDSDSGLHSGPWYLVSTTSQVALAGNPWPSPVDPEGSFLFGLNAICFSLKDNPSQS